MTGPIRPEDVPEAKAANIPDEVFEVFNELIVKHMSGERAVIRQDEIVRALEDRGYARTTIYDEHWLDVEPVYEGAGWTVIYDRPAYCETYPATFTFKRGK